MELLYTVNQRETEIPKGGLGDESLKVKKENPGRSLRTRMRPRGTVAVMEHGGK